MLKGLTAGTTTVTAKVKTKNETYTLKSKITVTEDISQYNQDDVNNLKKLIKTQIALGAKVSEILTSEEYTWDKDSGNLLGINWERKELSGSLDVSSLINLETLYCQGNNFTELKLTGLTKLQVLKCGDNHNLKSLDLTGLTSLQKLFCYYIDCTSLDVSTLTELTYIVSFGDYYLDSIDVTGLTKLTKVWCDKTLEVIGATSVLEIDRSLNGL